MTIGQKCCPLPFKDLLQQIWLKLASNFRGEDFQRIKLKIHLICIFREYRTNKNFTTKPVIYVKWPTVYFLCFKFELNRSINKSKSAIYSFFLFIVTTAILDQGLNRGTHFFSRYHPRTFQAKFGPNQPSSSRREANMVVHIKKIISQSTEI